MAKAYKDMASLAKAYEPDVEKMNNQILVKEASELERQAHRLLADINMLWQRYEDSYQPAVYDRTGQTALGFSLSSVDIKKKTSGHVEIGIDLILEEDKMWHDSIFGDSYAQGHSFMSISEGWHAPALETYRGRIDRFTHFDGVGIIDALVRQYNTADYEFKFYFEGEEYA